MIRGYPFETLPDFRLGPIATSLQSGEVHRELLSRRSLPMSDPRKVGALRRYQIFSGSFRDLVKRRISLTRHDEETIAELGRHVSMALNVAMDITRQACVVYRHGARRTVEGATDDEKAALHALLKEFRFDVWAPVWNQMAFFLGPVLVIPVNRVGVMRHDLLRPDFYDLFLNPDDATGTPLAAAFGTRPVHADDQTDTVIVDADAWTYYSAKSGDRMLSSVPHAIGEFPGSPLRMFPALDDWMGEEHDRATDATIDAAVLVAQLQMVRKAQSHKLLTVIGDIKDAAKRQKIDPEGSLEVPTGGRGPKSVDIDIKDFDTPPSSFIAHIRFLQESAIEAFGIPSHAVTFDATSGSESERLRVSYEGLTEIREQQIPFARSFEHELVWKLVRAAQTTGHRLATRLPPVDKVKEGYRVTFPRLARTFNDPGVEMAWWDWMLNKGQTSRLEIARGKNPSLDDEQVKTMVEGFVDDEVWWQTHITARNQPLDGGSPIDDLETPDQTNGREGGLTRASRAQQRREQTDDQSGGR